MCSAVCSNKILARAPIVGIKERIFSGPGLSRSSSFNPLAHSIEAARTVSNVARRSDLVGKRDRSLDEAFSFEKILLYFSGTFPPLPAAAASTILASATIRCPNCHATWLAPSHGRTSSSASVKSAKVILSKPALPASDSAKNSEIFMVFSVFNPAHAEPRRGYRGFRWMKSEESEFISFDRV